MTPEDIATLERTLEELQVIGPAVAHRFYLHLFRLDPTSRALFPDEMGGQEAKFFAELTAIARAVPTMADFLARGQRLGRLHANLGIRPSHFASGWQALEATLAEIYADDQTGAVNQAWRRAYRLVAHVMQEAIEDSV